MNVMCLGKFRKGTSSATIPPLCFYHCLQKSLSRHKGLLLKYVPKSYTQKSIQPSIRKLWYNALSVAKEKKLPCSYTGKQQSTFPSMLFQVSNCSYLEFPENTACVSVVIMSWGDVFNSSLIGFQILLHVLEEPRLVVVADSVYL